jgi:hypothetical protein
MNVNVRNLAIVVGVLVLLGAGGWFGMKFFTDSAPDPMATMNKAGKAAGSSAASNKPADTAAAKPKPPKPNPDKLVEALVESSRMQNAVTLMSQSIADGFTKNPPRAKIPVSVRNSLDAAVTDAFKPELFTAAVRERLKSNFDPKHAQDLDAALRKPEMQKVLDVEQIVAAPQEVAAFADQMKAAPLAASRAQLIEQMDAAMGATELATESAIVVVREMLRAAAQGDPQAEAKVQASIGEMRGAMSGKLREAMQMRLAFTYRSLGDAELANALAVYQGEAGKWFSQNLKDALLAQLGSGASKVGEQLMVALKDMQGAKLAAGPAMPPLPPGEPGASARPGSLASPEPMPLGEDLPVNIGRSYPRGDLRRCLDQSGNGAVIRCSEGR